MRILTMVVWVGILLGIPRVVLSQTRAMARFTVQAGASDRYQTPVSASVAGMSLPDGAYHLVEWRSGKSIRCASQLDGDRLWWILDGKTPAGSSRVYELREGPSAEAPNQKVKVVREKGRVKMSIAGKDICQYQMEPPPLPEGVSTSYRRGGFLHPLWSPSGEVLTRIQPPDHYHHVGIWNPWTSTEYLGRKIDFWNLAKEQGTVRPAGVFSIQSNEVFGGLKAVHEHIVFSTEGEVKEDKALNEGWAVRAWNPGPDAKLWLIDFTSTLNCATDEPFIIKAYRYQGFGFRATEKWDDQTATLLTDTGKDKGDGNGTRTRWCDVRGVSRAGTSGILFMTHPLNHNFPEQVRIWPVGANKGKENVFFNFNPAQEQDWPLRPGQEYMLRYRMLVYDGEISTETAERYWQDFAHPPKVEIQPLATPSRPKVLVYTKNGEGYVHDNLAASIAAIQQFGEENGFDVNASDDPNEFTDENLSQYEALIFSNTNNDIFDSQAQKEALQRYIRAGGGFVGIHSACGSERQWPWFWQMLGGKFYRHAPLQDFEILRIDSSHLSTQALPQRWAWEDECYYLKQLNPDIKVVLAADLNTVEDEKRKEYPGEIFGQIFPISWYHHFEGGRQWYTSLGHKIEYYRDPIFLEHLRGGILWVLNQD